VPNPPTPTPTPTPPTPPADFLADCAAFGLEFEPGELERLGRYLGLLLETNQTMNLTAVRDEAAAWKRHIFDSLTLVPFLADLPEGSRVIDVGSGGGLPGIPLAIALPSLRFTLLEATGKKADFLRTVARALPLPNVNVISDRAETLGHDRGTRHGQGRTPGHREVYDAVVSRAVARLPTLLELTVPFAKPPAAPNPSGMVLLVKGERAQEELAEAQGALHLLKAVHTQTVETPTGRVLVIEKGAATPRIYPRANGEPKRVPLGVTSRD
jgi:16S rRNA (guanine527-N7)-methyltransferase